MSEHIDTVAEPAGPTRDRSEQNQRVAEPISREAAIAAVERSFDGPGPPMLRVAAALGQDSADRQAAFAGARFHERQAAEALRALSLRRRGLDRWRALEADPDLRRIAATLTRNRHAAVDRLAAAHRFS